MILSIDGLTYDVMCSIRRQGDVRDTDISGELLDGSYFHDVEGTYFDYQISFLYPLYDKSKYDALYEHLMQPVDGHVFILPYNYNTITLTAKVDLAYDDMLEMDNGFKFWRALTFTLTSNAPTKEVTLSGTLTRGRAPLPVVSEPSMGDSYTWNGEAWEKSVVYVDVDNKYF